MQALERRIGEYKDDFEAIMSQLRIPLESSNLRRTLDWKDSTTDYQFLHQRLKEVGQRANGLNAATAALAGLTNNRQIAERQQLALQATKRTIKEVKSVKTLMIIGVVFLLRAYVATLYSMTDPYKPGGKLFWVYLVSLLPIYGLIVLGYYTLELGYTDGEAQWSPWTAIAALKKSLE